MKLDCKVIEDLLPLYLDDECSYQSKNIVEEHLEECSKCAELVKSMKNVSVEQIYDNDKATDDVLKAVFKKIQRRWTVSIIAMLMIIPIILVSLLVYHEVNNDGIAFSNIDDIYRGYKFLHYIEKGKFENASEMVDFTHNRYELVESVANMSKQEYQAYMKERFIKKLNEYSELGIYINKIKYDYSYGDDDGWRICMSFYENYPDGSSQKIVADLNGDTMRAGAYSYPDKDQIQRDDYIDEILSLYSEDDILDYQEYNVTFELKEGEKVIIKRNENSKYTIEGAVNISYGTASYLIEEPYNQTQFESSVPGEYSIISYSEDLQTVFLKKEDLDIQIIKY